MKLKLFKRIIVFGVLLTFIALCAAGFAGCKSCDGDDDIDVDPPKPPTETDPTKIGYYTLPDSFVLSLSVGDVSYNFVLFEGGYYADSAQNGGLLSRRYLKKTGDTFAYYESSYVSGEFVWGEAEVLSADNGAKYAFLMFSYILNRQDGEASLENVSVQGTEYQCLRTVVSIVGVSDVVYYVLKDYDFWIKNERSLTSGATTTEATLLNLSPTVLPDFVSLPEGVV